jgi:hypothetical protein
MERIFPFSLCRKGAKHQNCVHEIFPRLRALMSFQSFNFLSGLAYLALCLLIAVSGARKKCLRDGSILGGDFKAPTEVSTIGQTGQLAGENGRQSSASLSPKSLFLLSVSCLISLSSFLFMPCGTLPSLIPVSGSALIVIGATAVAPGFQGGWQGVRRQGSAPFCLGVSLVVIAWYARQRGVPGDLYTLDAYVAMPIIGVVEGMGKLGICVLAAVSLLALWKAWPVRQAATADEKPWGADEAFLVALAAELWILAVIGFWICLFFPFSFTQGQVSGIFALGGLALNALFFWVKVLGLAWLLEKRGKKWPHGVLLHDSILFAFLALGVWLLFDAAAG